MNNDELAQIRDAHLTYLRYGRCHVLLSDSWNEQPDPVGVGKMIREAMMGLKYERISHGRNGETD